MARKIFQAISDDTHTYAVIETAGGGGGRYRHPVKLSAIRLENDDIQTLSSARILGNAKVDVIESWDVDSRNTGSKSQYAKTLGAMLDELPSHVQGDVLHDTGLVANPEADFKSTIDGIERATEPFSGTNVVERINAATSKHGLFLAVQASHDDSFEVVQGYLADGYDPNYKSQFGETPLHVVGSMDLDGSRSETSARIAQALIDAGADVNATHDRFGGGDTPLHSIKHASVAQVLINNGADSELKNSRGMTAATAQRTVLNRADIPEAIDEAVAWKRRQELADIAAQHRPTDSLTDTDEVKELKSVLSEDGNLDFELVGHSARAGRMPVHSFKIRTTLESGERLDITSNVAEALGRKTTSKGALNEGGMGYYKPSAIAGEVAVLYGQDRYDNAFKVREEISVSKSELEKHVLAVEARELTEQASNNRADLTDIAAQHRPTDALTKHAAQQACERADQDGWTELSDGVYLNSSESIQEEQAQWNDGDNAKHVDFSKAPYWLTTDDGQEPVAISGADDADLLEAVSVDERVASYAQERAEASASITLPQRPQEALATAEQVQAKRQAYGRMM